LPNAAPVGWVDSPADEATFSTALDVVGWASAPDDIERVEVRMSGNTIDATLGISRPDVAATNPGNPHLRTAGFRVQRELDTLRPQRQPYSIVAVSASGLETVLGRRSLIPVRATALWADVAVPRQLTPFYFLLATSGVASGGAKEVPMVYKGYSSLTQRIGISVPVLYLRTTLGERNDWKFDPTFDTTRKCREGPVAEDSLANIIKFSIETATPVQFVLNGGIWADASCDTPEWDLNDHLEQDDANVQWSQDDRTFPDDYLRNLAGSTASPELARSLTLNVYATKVRQYKKRNLQAAARTIAQFAREHPELFVGVNLDADTYVNPFFEQREWFDYNPHTVRQFREWLQGIGPYARAGRAPGVVDLSRFALSRALSLAEVNQLAGKVWGAWGDVEPPRSLPRSPHNPLTKPVIWDDPWFRLWDQFRKQLVAVHYDELAKWTREAGIPKGQIFTAQGFVAPDDGVVPFALRIDSGGQNYDSGGVSVEGAIPRDGHLGAILYGPALMNSARMEGRHGIFATFARADPTWAVVESNLADLKHPNRLPRYADAYRAFRDLFNYDARQISVMAWNGSNGIYAGQPGYVSYTSWRNTPAEDAMRDYLVSHAGLPRGARLWSFGSAQHADDDGWSVSAGRILPRQGGIHVQPAGPSISLVSPADQVIRKGTLGWLVLGMDDSNGIKAVDVSIERDPGSTWVKVGSWDSTQPRDMSAAGLRIPLTWPSQWGESVIVERLRIDLLLAENAVRSFELQRVALLPKASLHDVARTVQAR